MDQGHRRDKEVGRFTWLICEFLFSDVLSEAMIEK